jgi:hypothetical protein
MADRLRSLQVSDLVSLWDECRRCFYLDVVSGFPRPRPAVSSVVNVLHEQVKAGLDGRRTDAISPQLPAGVLECGTKVVDSAPLDIQVPDGILRCELRGALDAMIKLDDGTFAVVDLEISDHGAVRVPVHTRRLQACAHALEHPAPGGLALGPVSRLGVLVFEPRAPSAAPLGLAGSLHWIEITRDESAFFGFLAEALTLLDQPAAPGGAPLCPWCVYRDASRRTGL